VTFHDGNTQSMPLEEWRAVQARRALLRQQTELIGPHLPWLQDPALIPDDAIAASVAPHEIDLAAWSLAGWMLFELVRATQRVYRMLDWERAVERFQVELRLHESVARAVLSPASRHAPGLFAVAEIISVVPRIASRAGLPRDGWHEIARRSEAFGAKLALDNTTVQVLVRDYLKRTDAPDNHGSLRALNPVWLRLDDAGLTTVTPLEALLTAARDAAARHGHDYRATCVALQARAPDACACTGADTMFAAIWSSFAHAANRLVFPRFDARREPVLPETLPDPNCAATLEGLAARHDEVLRTTAAQPYPPALEEVLRTLVSTALNTHTDG